MDRIIRIDGRSIGEIKFRGQWHPGTHTPLVEPKLWDRVHPKHHKLPNKISRPRTAALDVALKIKVATKSYNYCKRSTDSKYQVSTPYYKSPTSCEQPKKREPRSTPKAVYPTTRPPTLKHSQAELKPRPRQRVLANASSPMRLCGRRNSEEMQPRELT